MTTETEKRRHFRLPAHLPLDILLPNTPGKPLRRISSNVSAGGVYFQTNSHDAVQQGQKINLRIAIPPAVGRSHNENVMEGEATILRIIPLPNAPTERVGIACEFTTPLIFA